MCRYSFGYSAVKKDGVWGALKSDGTVVAVGNNGNGQCAVESWTDIVDISVSDGYTAGLKSDGTVVGAGGYDNEALATSEWADVIKISSSVETFIILLMMVTASALVIL